MENGIIIIGGATASGKSGLALQMARGMDAVIINADSMQVYRELPVLTAQPSEAAHAEVPHALYGFLPASERCSVARWLASAKAEIDRALEAGKTPILVGGTGLYLRCLVQGIAVVPEIAEELRMQARALLEEIGNQQFHTLLAERDPPAAARLHPGDSQRMLRAWEVVAQTQVPLHEWQNRPQSPLYPRAMFRCYAVTLPREELYARCDARFLSMLGAGGLEEARAFAALKLDPSLPAMKALGVPELLAFLEGKITREEAITRAQQATRNYAKRQLTWFNNQFPDWERIAP